MLKSLILLTVLLAQTNSTPAINEANDGNWRIVGGSDAGTTDAPYQVSLRSNIKLHFCGGSIINTRTIVTAAHCIYRLEFDDLTVFVGTIYLNSGSTEYALSKIMWHPEYDSNSYINDVAVLITSTAISMSSTVAPISLSTSTVEAGTTVMLTGWGTTTYPGTKPNNLQKINLKTISVPDCESKLSTGVILDTHICTYTKVGEGSCSGDSGGPLVAGNTLVGIVSWGFACARGYPDVFTRVSSFVDWIQSNAQH